MSFFKDVLPLLFSIAVVVLVLYLSYRFSKYLATKATKLSGSDTIQVKERTMLSQDKGLAIVCIADMHYLIGFSNQEISILKELPDYHPVERDHGQNFAEIFKTTLKGQWGIKAGDNKHAK